MDKGAQNVCRTMQRHSAWRRDVHTPHEQVTYLESLYSVTEMLPAEVLFVPGTGQRKAW